MYNLHQFEVSSQPAAPLQALNIAENISVFHLDVNIFFAAIVIAVDGDILNIPIQDDGLDAGEAPISTQTDHLATIVQWVGEENDALAISKPDVFANHGSIEPIRLRQKIRNLNSDLLHFLAPSYPNIPQKNVLFCRDSPAKNRILYQVNIVVISNLWTIVKVGKKVSLPLIAVVEKLGALH